MISVFQRTSWVSSSSMYPILHISITEWSISLCIAKQDNPWDKQPYRCGIGPMITPGNDMQILKAQDLKAIKMDILKSRDRSQVHETEITASGWSSLIIMITCFRTTIHTIISQGSQI